MSEQPEIVSTNQGVNLTATIASLSALAALFLCFADQRSRAIRRFSIQSVGLGVVQLAVGMLVWILSAVLGWIPVVGRVLCVLLLIAFCVLMLVALVLRVRMMYHAYRGEAHVLPVIGQSLRRFE